MSKDLRFFGNFSFRKVWLFLSLLLFTGNAVGQYRVDKLIEAGRLSLYYQDYVVAIKYFNWAITSKPYLYEPWRYRAVAKYLLDDYVGSETDAAQAISLNPYVGELYDLRAVNRFYLQNFDGAVQDWSKSLEFDPENRRYMYNRALCEYNLKKYDEAENHLSDIVNKWKEFSDGYSLLAEVKFAKKDTVEGEKCLDQSLKLDPYSSSNWQVMMDISYNRRQWNKVNESATKVIYYDSKNIKAYLIRAIARTYLNRLREALEDYDDVIKLDPNNFRGHYNRAMLRKDLGDDNRAIQDFDFIAKREPNNWMVLLNRALLNEQVGNLKAAVRDYSALLKTFPNFWFGYYHRAACYRKLGMKNKAELDDFQITKAQMNKHLGIQPRWSANHRRAIRKLKEIDFDKYDSFVEADEQDSVVLKISSHKAMVPYHGAVQQFKVEADYRPMFELTFFQNYDNLKGTLGYIPELEAFNGKMKEWPVYVVCNKNQLDDVSSMNVFSLIDKLSADLSVAKTADQKKNLLLRRGIAYSVLHDFESALSDFNEYITIDDKNPLVYWQKAVCETEMNEFESQEGNVVRMGNSAEADLSEAIKLNNKNAYIYYNRGNYHVKKNQLSKAIDDYTKAIEINPTLAEAYFNRGLARMKSNNKTQAMSDLSKAGELGIIDAYSIIKQLGSSKKK